MIPIEDHLSCLGERHDSHLVKGLLQTFKILRTPALPHDDLERGQVVEISEPQDWLANTGLGVEFGFEDEAAFLGAPPSTWGEGPMLLTQIYLFVDHPDQSRYQGDLPYGIVVGDDRETIRAKMSKSGMTLRARDRDTWVFKDYFLTVDYGGEGGALSYLVLLADPKVPQSEEELADRCPDIATLRRILGRKHVDPELVKALNPIRFASRFHHYRSGEAGLDIRDEFGADFDFQSLDAENSLVLTKIKLLGDRRYGSAIWPGELPGGLNFQMGWQELLTCAGRVPDEVLDGDFIIQARWRSDGPTTEIEYSTMENQILSVSLWIPGD